MGRDSGWKRGYVIADADGSAYDNAGCDAAESPHCIVSAYPQDFFHARARMTLSGRFQDSGTDLESLLLESEQIDAAGYDVAPQILGKNLRAPDVARDRGEVFGLNQGHLPRACGPDVAITNDTLHQIKIRALYRKHWLSAARPEANPNNLPRFHRGVQELGKGRRGIESHNVTPSKRVSASRFWRGADDASEWCHFAFSRDNPCRCSRSLTTNSFLAQAAQLKTGGRQLPTFQGRRKAELSQLQGSAD